MFNFQRFMLLMRHRFALNTRELRINAAVMFGIVTLLIGASLAIGCPL